MRMHVAAHPDDDLYFMNPDVSDAIRSGQPVITLYVTAGDLEGVGATPGERARSRQRGIMDAYAHMAGVPFGGTQTEWDADVAFFAGHSFDRYRLRGTDVTALFMGLPDHQLASLDSGGATLTTVPATGGAGALAQTYTRGTVVSVLTAVFQTVGPTVVGTLDTNPDTRYVDDHPDHVASARMATDAVQLSVPRPVLTSYRAYGIGVLPANLSPAVEASKRDTALVYGPYDPAANPGNYPGRMRHRWGRGVQWAARDAGGRIVAGVVRGGRLLVWVRDGAWIPAVDLGNPGVDLLPGVAVGRNQDGRLEIFARTTDHRIVNRWQTTSGSWYPSWGDLGNHNAGLSNAGQMGTPIVFPNADGRLQIAVKNGGGGVSSRWQTTPNGSWKAWTDLYGSDVQDGLTFALAPDGRIELFAPTLSGVLHWYQTSPNGAMVMNTGLPAAAPASELSAVRGADDRVRLVSRRDGGGIAVTQQTAPNNGWAAAALGVGPAGYGQIVLAANGGQVSAYAATPSGVTAAALDNGGLPGPWIDLAGPRGDAVTAVTGSDGAAVVLGVDTDERVYQWTGSGWVLLP